MLKEVHTRTHPARIAADNAESLAELAADDEETDDGLADDNDIT